MKNSLGLSLSKAGAVAREPIAPVVDTITPSTRYTGGGQTVTLGGLGLKSPTGVTVDGVSVTVNSSSWRSLTFTTAAKAAGTYDVVVTNALGSSTPISLTFAVAATCTVTDCSPKYAPTSGGTVVTLTGTFVPEDLACSVGGVDFANGTTAAITYVDATTATIVIPVSAGGYGNRTIWVEMYGSAADLSSTLYLCPVPAITSVDVTTRALAGTGTITVTGTDFRNVTAGGNTGTLGGTAVTLTYVNSTTVTFTAPSHTAGAKDLVITNIGGTSDPLVGAVTYYAAPTIVSSSVAPKTYETASVLTVSDSTSMSGGTLDGTPLTGFSILSPTTVACTFPAKAAGTYDLVLTGHPGGSTPAFSIATVNTTAVLTSSSPTEGPIAGNDAITFTGSRFGNGNVTGGTMGGAAITSFSVVDDTSATGVTPAGTEGTRSIVLTGPAGSSNAINFEYTNAAYTPLDDSPILWLRADLGVTTSMGEVTAWADQSGNGNDFIKGLVGPTVNASNSDFNGVQTLHFAGGVSAESLKSAASITYGAHVTCIVCKTTAGLRLYVRYGSNQLSSVYVGGGPVQIVSGDNTNLDLRAAASFVDHPAYARIVGHRWDGTEAGHILSEDGSDFSMTTYSSSSPSSTPVAGDWYLFSFTATSEYVTGDVAEVVVFPDGTDLTSYLSYANARCGL